MTSRGSEQQSFFSGASNVNVSGGTFKARIIGEAKKNKDQRAFELLQEHVATSALHNPKQLLNRPRCHKHTREVVLQELFDWIAGKLPRTTCMAWLNGAAGAGKTAICQSLVETCIARGILVASFFFWTDTTRNTIDRLVTTLAYQVIQLLPKAKKLITKAIRSNPLIFEQSLETQLTNLIVKPLRSLHTSDPTWKLVLIIDGVDECGQPNDPERKNLICTFADILHLTDFPLVVLFGSRRDYDLVMAFSSQNVDVILCQFPLDGHYQAEKDIRLFLDDSFDNIKKTHPFKKDLPANWPSPSHIQEIVDKSSGQFIYASVVIKFLSIATTSPSNHLDIVRGLRPLDTVRKTPFAELDALYRHIFAQIINLAAALKILAFTIFGIPHFIQSTLYFLQITREDMRTILAPLASVLGDLDEGTLTFSHASLPEFLRCEERSREFCINMLANQLSLLWFDNLASGRFPMLAPADITNLIEHVEASAELHQKLLAYAPSQQHSSFRSVALNFCGNYPARFLTAVRDLKFGDDGKAYKYLLNAIVRYVKKEFPASVSNIAESGHDISHILEAIKNEEQEIRVGRFWNNNCASYNTNAAKVEGSTIRSASATPLRSLSPASTYELQAPSNVALLRTVTSISESTRETTKSPGTDLVGSTVPMCRPAQASMTSDVTSPSSRSSHPEARKRGAPSAVRATSHPNTAGKGRAPVARTVLQVAQVLESNIPPPRKRDKSRTCAPPSAITARNERSVKAVQTKVTPGKSPAAPKARAAKKPPWR